MRRQPIRSTMYAASLLIAGLPAAAIADEVCGQEIVPFDRMLARLKAIDGVELSRDNGLMAELADPKRLIIWTLYRATDRQPAAYICRKIVQENGKVSIHMSAGCYGTTPGCDGTIAAILQSQHAATAPLRNAAPARPNP